MRVGAVPVFMTIVALTGCSNDATGPVATTVAVTVFNATGPFFEQPTPTQTIIKCGLEFRASASGGGTATWLYSWVLFYGWADPSVPVDSIQLPQVDVRREWGADHIESGKDQHSVWILSATAPFRVEFRFRYQLSDQSIKETSATHTCGPPLYGGSGPPALGQVTLEPPSGEVQGGDTITVSYSAASPIGLWETHVVFSGACDWDLMTFENFAPTVARTVKTTVPAACRLGDALNVNVVAFDIGLRGAVWKTPATLTVVDRTPPQISVAFLPGLSPTLQGYFFTGDTLGAYLSARDNNALSGLFWELWPAGRRDSLRSSGPRVADYFIRLAIGDSVGRIQLRLYSRDAVGLVSDTIVTDSLRIYPTIQRSMRSITTADAIYDVIFDEARGLLYLRHPDALRITVLSASDLTEAANIPLPGPAYDFDLSAGGDTLVLALGTMGALGIVDLAAASRAVSLLPLTTLNTAFQQHPVRVRLAASGKALVVLGGATYLQTTLIEVDPVGRGERVRIDAGDSGVVGYVTLERSNNHQVIVVSGDGHSQRYEALGDAFGPVRNASAYPHQVRVDATGTRIALGLSVFDAGLQLERRVESPVWDHSAPVALSPDGRILYQYSLSHGVVRSDATDGHLMDRTHTPGVGLMRVSPDGTMLALLSSKTIRLMDLR